MNNLNKLLKGEHILGLTNVHFEKKIEFVVLVKPESKLVLLIPPRMCSPLQGHWNYFTWISLVPWLMLALEGTSMDLLLLMITLGTLGYSL
jgi:hypothetical protein